jgi:N-acetylglutamate synthase-like GNAT family acetyltransferase
MQIAKPNQFQEEMAVLALCVHEPNESKLSRIAQQYHNDRNMELYVEKMEERVICIIGIKKQNENTYEIKHIAVIPEYREKGIVRGMIEYISNKHDMKIFFAETDKDAVDFYRSRKIQVYKGKIKEGEKLRLKQ